MTVSGAVPGAEGIPAAPRRQSIPEKLRRLSDRTPLRTKLITALLGLVILALVAISVAGSVMLKRSMITQRDAQLNSNFQDYVLNALQTYDSTGRLIAPLSAVNAGEALSLPTGVDLGIQLPKQQLSWQTQIQGFPIDNGSASQSLPSLPTDANWASSLVTLTLPSQSGPDTWRVMAIQVTNFPVEGSGPETVTVVVAAGLGNLNALSDRLEFFDFFVGGAIVIVLAGIGIAVVRANLRALNDIELTAGQIAAGHLDHRVPEGDPRTEIGSLGRSLNAMLAQIERAFHAQGEAEQSAHRSEERMRQFIADAAHELRTPLTTIRGFAAHYRQRGGASRLHPDAPVPIARAGAAGQEIQHPAFRTGSGSSSHTGSANGGPARDGLSAEELDHLMGRVESEATRMGMLVEDLLTLARLDQQRPLNKGPVDLLTLAADAVQDARIVAPGRPIDLSVAPGTAFLIEGDEARLRQVVANLVNNAITHTPADTPVRVKIARGMLAVREPAGPGGTGPGGAAAPTGAGKVAGTAQLPEPEPWFDEADTSQGRVRTVPAVVLDVEDEGPGMTTLQAQRVFERFYRADAARNRASGGTGLGLAIVAGLVAAHGGTVSVRTAPGQGADFQVKLPLSPDALVADDHDPDDSDGLPA